MEKLSYKERGLRASGRRLLVLLRRARFWRVEQASYNQQQAQIERSVVRIIYGGLIQNAPSKPRLEELLTEYTMYVCRGLGESLKNKYTELLADTERQLSIWVTSKVVMELLDSCSAAFDIDVAEFYNLLYGPILYYQDREQEIGLEGFGAAFGVTPKEIGEHLPSDPQMLSLLETCKTLAPLVLGTTTLRPARKAQLKTLLDVYGDNLPREVFRSYESFLTSEVSEEMPSTGSTYAAPLPVTRPAGADTLLDNTTASDLRNWLFNGRWSVGNDYLGVTEEGIGGIYKNGIAWKDYILSFDLRIMSQCAGWIVRAQSTDHYVMIQLGERRIRPHVRQRSMTGPAEFRLVTETPHGLALGEWTRVRTEVRGESIRVWLNDRLVWEDDGLLADFPTGTVGFRCHGKEHGWFRHIRVQKTADSSNV